MGVSKLSLSMALGIRKARTPQIRKNLRGAFRDPDVNQDHRLLHSMVFLIIL